MAMIKRMSGTPGQSRATATVRAQVVSVPQPRHRRTRALTPAKQVVPLLVLLDRAPPLQHQHLQDVEPNDRRPVRLSVRRTLPVALLLAQAQPSKARTTRTTRRRSTLQDQLRSSTGSQETDRPGSPPGGRKNKPPTKRSWLRTGSCGKQQGAALPQGRGTEALARTCATHTMSLNGKVWMSGNTA